MNFFTIGSLNIDFVYNVPHICRDGETISASKFEVLPGGKGLNQACALAKAGADITFAGIVGIDGDMLIDTLKAAGVKTEKLIAVNERNGHALIQVAEDGQNAIVLYGGTNKMISKEYIDNALKNCGKGDAILLQNEISNSAYAIEKAKEIGMIVAFNPSPISAELKNYPLNLVDILIVNEIEGAAIADLEESTDYDNILNTLHNKFPNAAIALTLGDKGCLYIDNSGICRQKAFKVSVVDTTAAGDTFCGYLLTALLGGKSIENALKTASAASALAVGKKGAAVSIPTLSEAEAFIAGKTWM